MLQLTASEGDELHERGAPGHAAEAVPQEQQWRHFWGPLGRPEGPGSRRL